jgi:(p)ppGpp synthase/HD superfamily hydrolase
MDSEALDRDSIFLYGVTMGSFLPGPLPLTRKAITFASQCHKGERRDNNEPYISHPLAACKTLITLRVTDDKILAAIILHDVVENGHATFKEIKKRFGAEVANLVSLQTKTKGERPEIYFARVESAIGSILGKGADRHHNISNMIEVFDFSRLKHYVEETEEYILPMLKNARYVYLDYSNALVLLYDSMKIIIKLAKAYITAREEVLDLTKVKK